MVPDSIGAQAQWGIHLDQRSTTLEYAQAHGRKKGCTQPMTVRSPFMHPYFFAFLPFNHLGAVSASGSDSLDDVYAVGKVSEPGDVDAP